MTKENISGVENGGPGQTRTDTYLRTQDFESSASTNSTTGPQLEEI